MLTAKEEQLMVVLCKDKEVQEFVLDVNNYRKTVMRPYLKRDVINELRDIGLVPYQVNVTIAREMVMEWIDEHPVVKSSSPDKVITKIKWLKRFMTTQQLYGNGSSYQPKFSSLKVEEVDE